MSSLDGKVKDVAIRGRTLLTADEAFSGVESERPDWDPGIQWGPLRIPSKSATVHFCAVGAPGSGKTVLLRLLMQSVLPLIGATDKLAALGMRAIERPKSTAIVEAETTQPSYNPTTTVIALAGLLLVQILFYFELQEAHPRTDISAYLALGVALLTPIGAVIAASFTRREFVGCGRAIALGALFVLYIWLTAVFHLFLADSHNGEHFNWGFCALLLVLFAPPIWAVCNWLSFNRWNPFRSKRTDEPEQITKAKAPSVDPPTRFDGHRALIYDAKLEVVPQLHGMGLECPIVILNPFDERGSAWDMAKDITSPATAQQVASILIQEEKNASQPFFTDAARQLLQAALIAFIKTRPGNWTFRDVLLAMKSKDRLKALLEATPETFDVAQMYLASEDRTVSNVMATIGTKLGPFEVVAAAWSEAKESVSLSDWMEGEYLIVLANDESYRAVLDPINRVIFKRAVELTLAQRGTDTGRTWFFLDEVREAGNLDGLGRLMTKGRSVGAAIVLGFQDIQGMRDAFGKEPADEIIGLCANKALLRLESPETAKWASEVLGQYEVLEEKESTTSGETESDSLSDTKGTSYSRSSTSSVSPGSSTTTQRGTNKSKSKSTSTSTSLSSTAAFERKDRNSVMPSEFMTLPPTTARAGLTGFFLTHFGACKATVHDFPRYLYPEATNAPRVVPRHSDHQYLRPWTSDELSALGIQGKSAKPKDASSASGAPAIVANQASQGQLPKPKKHWLPDGGAEFGIKAIPEVD